MQLVKGLIVVLMTVYGPGVDATSTPGVSLRGRDLEATPCVFDQCPAIYVDGAGYSNVNGVYTPFQSCDSSLTYGKNTANALWRGYRSTNGGEFLWYLKDGRTFNGWGIGWGGDHRYYDGLNRNTPTQLQLDNFVPRSGYASYPAPTLTCLTGSTVFWKYISTNPTSTWSTTSGTQYTDQQKQMQQVQASIGVKYGGVQTSTSYQYQTEQTVSTVLSTTTTENCQNPCGTDRALWAHGIDAGLGDNMIMLPQCGMITCVPLGKQPLCPIEYCGGSSIFDGCQCCTSYDWVDMTSFKGTLPPLCSDKNNNNNNNGKGL